MGLEPEIPKPVSPQHGVRCLRFRVQGLGALNPKPSTPKPSLPSFARQVLSTPWPNMQGLACLKRLRGSGVSVP